MTDYERILLTGGAGFVGPYVQAALARAFPRAARSVLIRPSESSAPCTQWSPVRADLLDEAALDQLVAQTRPDLVVHLAAQASVAHSIKAAEATWRVNFQGSLNLASALARHSPQATVLFVSSAEVYGSSLDEGPATEDAPPRPLTAYARSKLAAEGMFADVLAPGSRLIVARPFNHTGPRQDKRFALPAFAAQIASIEQGRALPRVEVGDLSIERDFLDVRDVAEAYARLAEAAPRLPSRSLFNVSSGESRSLASLLEMLRRNATRDFEIVVDPERLRPADIRHAAADASRLRDAIGWRPSYAIEETLLSLLDHWRAVERNGGRAS